MITTWPESVIDRQLDAYNRKDLEAIIAAYADDASMYQHPDTLLARGAATLRVRFLQRFKDPNLHAQLDNRIVIGAFVIDHETIACTIAGSRASVRTVMIFEVRGERIANAWVISPTDPTISPVPAAESSTTLETDPIIASAWDQSKRVGMA